MAGAVIVVDVGCASYGYHWSSLRRLRRRFRPDHAFGIDPQAKPARGASIIRAAAWIFDGEVCFERNGTSSRITSDPNAERVRCIHLAAFLEELPPDGIVLKLDVEGAEYDLLTDVIVEGADQLLELCLVEWHGDDARRAAIEERISCPLELWTY